MSYDFWSYAAGYVDGLLTLPAVLLGAWTYRQLKRAIKLLLDSRSEVR